VRVSDSRASRAIPSQRFTTAEGPTYRVAGFGLRQPGKRSHVRRLVGLELRNVAANYPFERSHRFPGIQPNSGHRDYSRVSCDVGDTQLGPSARISRQHVCAGVGQPLWQESPRRPSDQHHCSLCTGLFPHRERVWWSRTVNLIGILSPRHAPWASAGLRWWRRGGRAGSAARPVPATNPSPDPWEATP
jgi:hypothetical protein